MISHRGNASTSHRFTLQSIGVSAVTVALFAGYAGCGGSVSHGGGASTDAGVAESSTEIDTGAAAPDTGADAAPDQGGPSSVYPAFKVDVAQIVNNGGSVLAKPVVVTVTWSTDPDAATYNALGDAIGPSTYWSDINSEYGIGVSTSGATNHISITAAPASGMSDADLDAFVEANAGVGSWPAPTASTIYAIYMPPGMDLYFGGDADAGGQDACSAGVGGYHTESQNKNIVYAIMPHCAGFATADVELGASHELNEAASDPHPDTTPAWVGFDQDHLSFEFFNQFQDELGDACESFQTATDATDFTPYTVQRQWSNKSAAAGSQWCLPKLDEPMYGTTFVPTSNLDSITADLTKLDPMAGKQTSKGFKIALNTTRVVPIGLFSDMPTSAPFTLDIQGLGAKSPIAQDYNGNNIANGVATVTLDKTSGVNGDVVNLSITPTSYSTLGITFFYIRAQLTGAQQHHYLPIIISAN